MILAMFVVSVELFREELKRLLSSSMQRYGFFSAEFVNKSNNGAYINHAVDNVFTLSYINV